MYVYVLSFRPTPMRILFTFLFALMISVGASAHFDSDLGEKDPFLKEFAVYPNPSYGEITVAISTFELSQNLQIKVFNLLGQEMQSQNLAPFQGTTKVSLDLTKLPKGIYMVEVTDGMQKKSKRITVI